MIPMLTKLLVTKIVARSLSGIFSSLTMIWWVLDFDVSKESISLGDKEKKAASAPETRADRTSSTKMAIRAKSKSRVNGFTVKPDTEVNAW